MKKSDIVVTFAEVSIDYLDGSQPTRNLQGCLCQAAKKKLLLGPNGNIALAWKDVTSIETLPDVRGMKLLEQKNYRSVYLAHPQGGPWDRFEKFVEKQKQKLVSTSGQAAGTQQKKKAKGQSNKRYKYGRDKRPILPKQDAWSDDEVQMDEPVLEEEESMAVVENHVEEGSRPENNDNDKEIEEEQEEEVNNIDTFNSSISKKTPKCNKRRRLQRLSIEESLNKMDDSDSGDELFEPTTTPIQQRVVTPGVHSEDDGSEEPDNESQVSPPTKGKIHEFFQPKKSRDNAAAAKATTDKSPSNTKSDLKKKSIDGHNATKTPSPKAISTKDATTPRVSEQKSFLPSPSRPNSEARKYDARTMTTVDQKPGASTTKRTHDELSRFTSSLSGKEIYKRARRPLKSLSLGQNKLFDDNSTYRGLRNHGNTCYLSSALQMIFTLNTFIDSLTGKGGALVESLVSTAREVSDSSENGPANARAIKQEIDKVSNKFEGYEQRDCHELTGDLIDLVHEEMIGKDGIEGAEKPPTDEWFRCDIETRLECTACKYSRTRLEVFRHLSLGVGNDKEDPVSIQESFESFFKPEEVDIKCEKCEGGDKALQTMKLVNRPKAILFHLKRFVVEQRTKENGEFEILFRKNKAKVFLSESVCMDKVAGDGISGQYSLCSFVRHEGATAASGHYTAVAARRRPSGVGDQENHCPPKAEKQDLSQEWVSFDDSKTAITSLEAETSKISNQKNAYLCLYALK